MNILLPVINASIYYWMAGLRDDDNGFHFVIFLVTMILVHYVIVSLAWMCSAISRSFANSSLIANTIVTFFTLVRVPFSSFFFLFWSLFSY
jgi:hypothetical protein